VTAGFMWLVVGSRDGVLWPQDLCGSWYGP